MNINRRSFISTITALAGLALAKIKAPAKPKDYLAYTGSGTFQPVTDFQYYGERIIGKLWTGETVLVRGNCDTADIQRVLLTPEGKPYGIVLKPIDKP